MLPMSVTALTDAAPQQDSVCLQRLLVEPESDTIPRRTAGAVRVSSEVSSEVSPGCRSR